MRTRSINFQADAGFNKSIHRIKKRITVFFFWAEKDLVNSSGFDGWILRPQELCNIPGSFCLRGHWDRLKHIPTVCPARAGLPKRFLPVR